jgi:hypothetical protein
VSVLFPSLCIISAAISLETVVGIVNVWIMAKPTPRATWTAHLLATWGDTRAAYKPVGSRLDQYNILVRLSRLVRIFCSMLTMAVSGDTIAKSFGSLDDGRQPIEPCSYS